jgi:peptidoglycan/LPS O-acetylase OafA/YrhL
MRLYPEDWRTGMPGLLAVLFAGAAGLAEDFLFGPAGNHGMGSFLVVFSLGLLALAEREKNRRRTLWSLALMAVAAPALHAVVDPGMDLGEAYLRALRQVPLGILAFIAVRALDRRIARPGPEWSPSARSG